MGITSKINTVTARRVYGSLRILYSLIGSSFYANYLQKCPESGNLEVSSGKTSLLMVEFVEEFDVA